MMHVRLFDNKQNIWILSLIFHNINFTISIGGMTTISDKGTVLAFVNARTVPSFVLHSFSKKRLIASLF
jgi:hypothetical protein